jgi:hypothetical protein
VSALRRARALVARLLLLLALVAAGQALYAALVEGRRIFRAAQRLRHETLAAAQERLFGGAYMNAIRRIRSTVPEDQVLVFIDVQSREQGAAYFVGNFLAPRPLVRLGSPRHESWGRLRRRIPEESRWILFVGDHDRPPTLEPAGAIRMPVRRAR